MQASGNKWIGKKKINRKLPILLLLLLHPPIKDFREKDNFQNDFISYGNISIDFKAFHFYLELISVQFSLVDWCMHVLYLFVDDNTLWNNEEETTDYHTESMNELEKSYNFPVFTKITFPIEKLNHYICWPIFKLVFVFFFFSLVHNIFILI